MLQTACSIYMAARFVETSSFALQSARFRNNAHVFRAKAHVRKTNEADGAVCRNDVQSTRLEPLGSAKNAFRARLPSKLHRQLTHQHHLQSHLHCGNDPTVANHNGILSTAHARKTLETPFTMRNRSDHGPRPIRP